MNFDSLAFVAFCIAATILLRALRPGMLRQSVIVALNLAFVSTFFDNAQEALPLAGFVAFSYGAVCLSAVLGPNPPLIGTIILLFAWIKKYDFLAFLPQIQNPYVVVGLSYILFRCLHLIVDVGEKAIKRPNFLSYLAYVLFFLSFVSGPIQRKTDFSAQEQAPVLAAAPHELYANFQRIIRGMALIGFVTVLTHFLFERVQIRLYASLAGGVFSLTAIALLCAVASIFTIHLYLNFGGYMDVVIGVGRLCGFSLPENFNRPYVSKNFLEFWSRWHITLSEWFKIYLFNPLMRLLSARWGTPARLPYLGVVAFFVTFFVMGIWHGSTRIFLAYGLVLGAGMMLNKLYQVWMTARLGKKRYKALSRQFGYIHLCRGMTLAFFALSIVCLWIDMSTARELIRPDGIAMILVAFAVLTAFIAILSAAIELVASKLASTRRRGPRLSVHLLPVWTAAQIFTVAVAIFAVDQKTPEFIYKAF
jgi:D-alanyl-lipoteichoic acid acyltransferase DltB (MBOAT superfamily)